MMSAGWGNSVNYPQPQQQQEVSCVNSVSATGCDESCASGHFFPSVWQTGKPLLAGDDEVKQRGISWPWLNALWAESAFAESFVELYFPPLFFISALLLTEYCTIVWFLIKPCTSYATIYLHVCPTLYNTCSKLEKHGDMVQLRSLEAQI